MAAMRRRLATKRERAWLARELKLAIASAESCLVPDAAAARCHVIGWLVSLAFDGDESCYRAVLDRIAAVGRGAS